MTIVRIALANLRFPRNGDDSITLAERAIAEAASRGAAVVCFPECFTPGYRAPGKGVAPPSSAFLERAWDTIARAAASAHVTVVLGTERLVDGEPVATVLVINAWEIQSPPTRCSAAS